MKKKNFNIFLAVSAITVGGILYILTRPDSHISVAASHFIPVKELCNIFPLRNSSILRYYAPDFLWAFGFACTLYTVNNRHFRVIFICSAVGVGWEFLQHFGIIGGTGDFIDIIMYLTAIFIVVLINKKECSK